LVLYICIPAYGMGEHTVAGKQPAGGRRSGDAGAANPRFVADYVFPGSISTNWTHLQNLKAAR